MAPLSIPDSGLNLVDVDRSETVIKVSESDSTILQTLQLDLAEGLLEEVLKSARHGGKGVHVSFGKTVVSHSLNNLLILDRYLIDYL